MNKTKTYQDSVGKALDQTKDAWHMPQDIGEWLGRLLLLYGVPFNYLVPQESMLPPESIRFFYLDPGWMKCLLEGACSVGKSSTLDDLFDQKLRNRVLDLAGPEAAEVRASVSKDLRELWEQDKEREKTVLNWPLTGFLLRSDLVEGWQGIEMQAWSEWKQDWEATEGKTSAQITLANDEKKSKRLQPLRIDRLAPDVMFCIFNGKVKHIEIKQPPEGLHFGAEHAANNVYKKPHLRHLAPAEMVGQQVDSGSEPPPVEIPMRKGSARVVDVHALAKVLAENLQKVAPFAGSFTSAELAVQMVESPGKAIFDSEVQDPAGGSS